MVRVRVEYFEQKGMTGYAISRASNGDITSTQIYRLIRNGGRVRYLDTKLLDRLCAVFDVQPGTLLVREADD